MSQLAYKKIFIESLFFWLIFQAFFFISALIVHNYIFPSSVGILDALCKFDCLWYKSIAEKGYGGWPTNFSSYVDWVFFPVFPAFMAIVSNVLNISYLMAAFIINSAAVFCFIFLALKFGNLVGLRSTGSRRKFLFLFLFSPYSIYFSYAYTEVLFNLFLLLSFIALYKGNYFTASISGFLLTATRSAGILLPIMFAVKRFFKFKWDLLKDIKKHFPVIVTLAIMPLGLVFFIFYVYSVTGDPLASFTGSKQWHRSIGSSLEFFWLFVKEGGINNNRSLTYSISSLIAGAVIGYIMTKRSDTKDLGHYILLVILLIAASGLHSAARYVWALFPLYIFFAEYTSKRIFLLLLAVFLVGKVLFITIWLSEKWASLLI